MQDIEDCGVAVPQPGEAFQPTGPTARSRRGAQAADRHGADVPGDATVFVQTFGCGHNFSDGEVMAGLLAERGYRITDQFETADCFLINSCTVKNPSEDHFMTLVKKARASGKPVVVARCVPQGDQKNAEWDGLSVIGVRAIDRVVEVVEESLRGNAVHVFSENLARESIPRLSLPKIRRNKFIEIIPINVGCLNNCTYCKTKHARGDLKSWPVDEIVARVREVVREEGVREIRLTSEDVGAYGIDIGTDIVTLLRAIANEVAGTRTMVRVGMSNPPYLLRHVEAFAAILQHPNFYEFVHIPVQSGSNPILDAMKREYTVEEFRFCVEGIRRVVPDVSIATDIICAFPGEGDREWAETMKLCADLRFPILNISRYYPRRGTPAAAMPQIPTAVAKKRTAELTKFVESYTCYDDLLGSRHKVDLLEVAHDKHHLVGHTKAYVQVLVDPAEAKLGDRCTVEITAVSKWSVTGRVVAQPEAAEAPCTPTLAAASEESNGPQSSRDRSQLVAAIAVLAVVAAAAFLAKLSRRRR